MTDYTTCNNGADLTQDYLHDNGLQIKYVLELNAWNRLHIGEIWCIFVLCIGCTERDTYRQFNMKHDVLIGAA